MNSCCQPRHCADSGGGAHEFLHGQAARSDRLHCTAGMTIAPDIQTAIGESRISDSPGDGRHRAHHPRPPHLDANEIPNVGRSVWLCLDAW
jgi:hypothetical protein